jgi:hypothetical protein
MSFVAITLYVASQRVFIVVSVYFVMTQSGYFWVHPRILSSRRKLNYVRNFCRILTMVYQYWTNCAFGIYPSSGVSRTNKTEELKIICVICLWTCVFWYFVYNFSFLNFVCSWDTRRCIKSKSTIRSINYVRMCSLTFSRFLNVVTSASRFDDNRWSVASLPLLWCSSAFLLCHVIFIVYTDTDGDKVWRCTVKGRIYPQAVWPENNSALRYEYQMTWKRACEGVSKSFRTESIKIFTLTAINIRWEATQRLMAAKFTRLTHKIAIQLHLGAEKCTICRSRSRRPVRKLVDTPSYKVRSSYALHGVGYTGCSMNPPFPRMPQISFVGSVILCSFGILLSPTCFTCFICVCSLASFQLQKVFLINFLTIHRARIAQWYFAALRARWSGVRFTTGDGNFSLHHRIRNDSGTHRASCLMGTRGSFPGGKAAEAWSWTLISI